MDQFGHPSLRLTMAVSDYHPPPAGSASIRFNNLIENLTPPRRMPAREGGYRPGCR